LTLHVIAGADSWLAEEALEGLLARAVDGDRGDSVQVLRGDECTWARVMDAARSRSLFAERRAVVVRNADALKGEGEDLPAFLADLPPDVALVLMAAKPDKRKTGWKAVMAAKAQVVAAEPLKGRAVRGYVVDQLKKRKLALADDAVEEVVERVGQDLRRLMGELDKLEAYAQGKPGRLSGDDVAAVLGRGLAPPLYKLADAVTARRAGTVLGLLETVLGEGEPPLKVLATLHRAIRQVRGAKALQEARAPRDMVASRLGVMPFKVGDLLQAARAWSEDDLRRATAALDLADRRVKTGSDPGMALTAAVVEATRSPRPSPRTAR
jgi:DNA polymerase-3 subunit delta